jgi:competence protein ComEA
MVRELRDWLEEIACRAGLDGIPSPARAVKPILVAGALVLVVWAVWGTGGGAAATAPAGSGPGSGPLAASAAASSSAAGTRSALPSAPSSITVHVVGEVRHPGVYELASGARAIDAVDAAGGLLGDAEQSAVNLARVVADGEQIAVPRQGEAAGGVGNAGAGGAAGVPGSPAGGKVDINTATAEQLDALPGVGPATAAKIIADRSANGPFRNVDDLMRVPGIGPSKFDALKDLIRTG